MLRDDMNWVEGLIRQIVAEEIAKAYTVAKPAKVEKVVEADEVSAKKSKV